MSHGSTGFSVRPMTLTDVAMVLAIASGLSEAPQWAREAYEASLAKGTALRRLAYVAEDQATGQLAGFAIASLMPPESELESIAVAEAFQRHGVGRSLWNALASELAEAGAHQAFLEVRVSNQRAQAFYRSLGFADVGKRSGYYADPKEDAVILRCNLP